MTKVFGLTDHQHDLTAEILTSKDTPVPFIRLGDAVTGGQVLISANIFSQLVDAIYHVLEAVEEMEPEDDDSPPARVN